MRKSVQYSLIDVKTDAVMFDYDLEDNKYPLTAGKITVLLSMAEALFGLFNINEFLKPDGTMRIPHETSEDDGRNYIFEIAKYRIVREEVTEVAFSPEDLDSIKTLRLAD